MKKYIAPEVEIKKFNVENIMAASATVTAWDSATDTSVNTSKTVTYDELFNLGSN